MILRRALSIACVMALAFAPLYPQPLLASQNSLQLPTTGTVSGLQFSNDVTDAIDSLATCNTGTTAPTNAAGGAPKAGQCWIDTTSLTLLKKYRYTGAAWVLEGVLDVTNGIWSPPVGGGAVVMASAATTSICGSSAPQGYVEITGTASISSFGAGCPAGQVKILRFDAALTLTYDATALILPAATDYATSAGDIAAAVSEGSGNWRLVIFPANGQAVKNPAVPLGTFVMSAAITPPSSYVLGFGQAITRSTHADYLAAVTSVQSVTRTSGSPTLTGFTSIAGFGAGMPVEGTGIPSGTILSSCTGTSCTMSANATTSGTSNATVFTTGYGAGGDGTTVGVPDCQGRALAGRDDMSGTAQGRLTTAASLINGKQLGAASSAQTFTIGQTNLPNVNFMVSGSGPVQIGGAAARGVAAGIGAGGSFTNDGSFSTFITSQFAAISDVAITGTAASGGSGTALSNVQPTLIANCMVRVLP